MGALGNTGDGRVFVNTFKGRFTRRSNEKTTGAIKRTNKVGAEVWELHFDTLQDVFLQKIEKFNSPDYGFQWNIYLAHAHSEETLKLSLPYSGRMTSGFFLRLPNIKIEKMLTFTIHYFPKTDKVALVVHQLGVKVPMYWTKENPGQCPDLEELLKDGKPIWDGTKRMQYIEQYMDAQIHPYLKMDGIAPPQPTQGAMGNTPAPEATGFHQPSTSNPANTQFPQQGSTTAVASAPPETVTPRPLEQIPEWDTNGGYLKKKHTDGKWYQCGEDGKFKRDDGGNMLGVLPF